MALKLYAYNITDVSNYLACQKRTIWKLSAIQFNEVSQISLRPDFILVFIW